MRQLVASGVSPLANFPCNCEERLQMLRWDADARFMSVKGLFLYISPCLFLGNVASDSGSVSSVLGGVLSVLGRMSSVLGNLSVLGNISF